MYELISKCAKSCGEYSWEDFREDFEDNFCENFQDKKVYRVTTLLRVALHLWDSMYFQGFLYLDVPLESMRTSMVQLLHTTH